jgi:metal-responsive CopG/Arc/MetJ family transcriptional regulator
MQSSDRKSKKIGTVTQRVTFSLDEDIAADFDDIVEVQRCRSRSEAVRDLK